MELDTKQKVLLALYTEYQKDLPSMKRVNADMLGLEVNVFVVAIEKLNNEGMINDVQIIRGGQDPYPLAVRLDTTKLTRYGIEYVESKLDIEAKLSGPEKVKSVTKKLGEWGLEQVKDVVARIASETIKGSM
ncbi:YjcQ protein [Aneurinibacillus soli]|uniref:Uncharacterized protein n=1 Tax=Aneurinibacillus soli TaxID=1500254 RepID=A0A0U5BC74_9BACL|nr:YjcQ family protein [Aneurinibacillus soli]PYE61618.1 YjcQ protein [Aneurinibacillus soli]BAU28524.1 hypothetical protein CB4_02698 [Aneurinibacillus soli]